MNKGLGMEVQQVGVVALIGLLVFPGLIWISKAKSGGSMTVRAVALAALAVSAIAVEAAMDKAAEPALEKL